MADMRFFNPWAAPIFANDAPPSQPAEPVPGPENTQVLADKIVQMMSAPSVFSAQPGESTPAELRSYQPTFTD